MANSDYRELFWKSSLDHQISITVDGNEVADNTLIESEAFDLEESLCSESELTFGACESNCIKFVTHGTTNLLGKTITVSEEITDSGLEPFIYGKYTVVSDVPTSDRTKREITAYDSMRTILNDNVQPWYATLTFPMTLKALRDSFFAYLGIEQVETTLVNDGITINKTITTDGTTENGDIITSETTISGKTIITAICELNGCFGNINRDGKFEYVVLDEIIPSVYPSDTLYPEDDLYPRDSNAESMRGRYIEFDYEDFQTANITQLEITASSDSAGALVGDTGNTYTISGNVLITDKTTDELKEIATNILPIISKVTYTPIKSSNCVGNPCVMLGEPLRFNTSRAIIYTYVLQRTLSGIQAKRDAFTSNGCEYYTQKVNSISEELTSVKGRTNKLERTADHTLSELSDLSADTASKFEQTADSIQAEVTARQGADSQISATLELKIDKDDDGTIISLINGSANRICFTATNMFTVNAPNIIIDAAGNVTLGGEMVSADNFYISYNYSTLATASKVKILGVEAGVYTIHGTSNYEWFNTTITSVGANLPILKFGTDACVIEAAVEFQAPAIYGKAGYFKDIAIDYETDSSYGGRIYSCFGATGRNYGIASTGWVRKWVEAQGYTTTPGISGLTIVAVGTSSGTAGSYSPYYYLNVANASVGSVISSCQARNILLSDRRAKEFITDAQDISSAYMLLKPVHFKFKDDSEGTDAHWHYGFIAQDVKDAFDSAGIDTYGEALVGCDTEKDEWLLDKDEMHAMHVQMIQKQQKEIEQLKNEINTLKQQMEVLQNAILSKNN